MTPTSPCRCGSAIGNPLANQTVLVIPDIHERAGTVERILDKYLPEVAEVVFLGDALDSFFHSEASATRTLYLLKDVLQDERMTYLLGNHCLHYLWPHMACSGYRARTQSLFDSILTSEERHLLRDLPNRTIVERHGWLLSHAGMHPDFLPGRDDPKWDPGWLTAETKQARRNADAKQQDHWLFAVSKWRGGDHRIGGPFWLDWNEFDDGPTVPPQIVGHTPGSQVRTRFRSYNLDTCSEHVALLAPGGEIAIEPVGHLKEGER